MSGPEKGGADAGGETSMEDILASIRRILTDEEAAAEAAEASGAATGGYPALHEPPNLSPGADVAAGGGASAPGPASTAAHHPAPPDVFELDHSMIVQEQEPPMPPTVEEIAPVAEEGALDDGSPLLEAGVAAAAGASLGALSRLVGQRQVSVYQGGPTIEDMVRQELRPLLKTWLDENLPPLVERLVRAEIARVAQSK